jgi:hypothetical protein
MSSLKARRARAGAALALGALLCGAAVAAPAHAQGQAPTPAAIDEAKKHMKAGAAFYNDPPVGHKCEEALREFAKAFDLSGSLNALKGMAVCNLELERDGDAIRGYTAYLAGKGSSLDPGEKAQLEADLNALKAAVATVKIAANRPGVRVVDERTPARGYPVRNVYPLADLGEKQLGIHPGQHVLTASLEGYPDQVWKIDLANGGTFTHVFTFEKSAAPVGPVAPPPVAPVLTRPVPLSVWVTTGLTGALGIGWAALAVRAKLKNDDYAKVNGKETSAQLTSLRGDVKTANLVADVFLGATVASLGTTLVLYFTRPTKAAPAAPAPVGGLYLAPTAGISGGGAVLGGSF